MTKRYWYLVVVLFCLLHAMPGIAANESMPQLKLRLSLQPEEGVVGQQHRLRLELLTSTWFYRAPELPSLQLDGVVVLPPQGFATNFTSREGGRTLAGQAYEYLLFPQRSGLIKIPSFSVTIWPSAEDGRPLPAQTLRSESLVLQVKTVPGQPPAQPLLVAEAVTLEEHYDQLPERLLQGDAISRRIDIHAQGIPGMLIPSLEIEKKAGESVYRAPLKVSDQYHRGLLAGERSEQLTYVLQHAGEVRLSAITLRWWNSKTQQLETLRLPERILQVLSRPGKAEPASGWWLYLVPLAMVLIVLLVLIALIELLRRGGRAERWQQWRQHRQELAEKRQLRRQLLQSCRSREAAPLLRGLYRWRDRYGSGGSGPKPLESAVGKLKRAYFSGDGCANIPYEQLHKKLQKLSAGKATTVAKPADLPPLYPETRR